MTERAGYQVETNAMWYNAVAFAIDQEAKYGPKDSEFIRRWSPVKESILRNFQPTFWNPSARFLAD